MKHSIENKVGQSGQIAIIILLIMVVLLTIGLSLASRTTQEVFLSQQDAESTRVFNAAESGVEDALSQDFSAIPGTGVSLPDVNLADVSTDTSITPLTDFQTQITEGAAIELDLTGSSGFVTIEFADINQSTTCLTSPALLISTYYDDNGTTKAIHDAIGPQEGCYNDNFEQATGPLSPPNAYRYRASIGIPSGATITPLFMRVRAVYMDAPVSISGLSANQFYVIRSEAQNDLGDENRTIQVGRGISTAPSFMDYSVYSGGSLTH